MPVPDRSVPVTDRSVPVPDPSSRIRNVSAADVATVSQQVTDPGRARPVLLVSVASDTGRPRVDPGLLTAQLGAATDVVVLTSMDAAFAWSDAVDPELRAYGGAIRLINPPTDADPGGVFLTYPETDPTLTVNRIRQRLAHPHPGRVHRSSTPAVGMPTVPPVTAPRRPTPNLLRRGPDPTPTGPPPAELPPPPGPPPAELSAPDTGSHEDIPGAPVEPDPDPARLQAEVNSLEQQLFLSWDELQKRDDEIAAITDEGSSALDSVYSQVVHADREQQFRHVLVLRVLLTVPEPDRPDDQLGRLCVSPRWLEDLDELPSVSKLKLTKVLDVVIEILRGQVWTHPAREVHQQRTGPGGEDPFVRRAEDDALAWRANLQHKTPQARRLLWWSRRDGSVELARVAAHDDYRMT